MIMLLQAYFLKDIKEKYFGESFSENPKLNTTLKVKNKGTYLAIRPTEYALPNMSEAYYVMAKITDVFNLWKSAEDNNYPLFEENIREYLGGTSGINKSIIATLKNPNERGNFFYYNNGITIICDSAKADAVKVDITNPQIVNGCQTVNSIAEVFKTIENPEKDFSDVYVMVKILILEKKNTTFYRDIVRYTNSQNSINEKVFGATLQPFFTIQEKLKEYGILLGVKQSDNFQFKESYKDKKSFGSLINTANEFSEKKLFFFKTLADLQMPLETLIQIIGSYVRDAHLAYTKKSYLLKPTSKEYYQEFSTKIGEILTIESMAKLTLLYKRSEKEKRESDDKRSPSPYFLLNFIGYYLRENKIDLQKFLKSIEIDDLDFIYEKFKTLSSKYIKMYNAEYGLEYNQIIKQKIDLDLMDLSLNSHLQSLEEYNNGDYLRLIEIFEKNK
jgi:hypothetical protein